MVKYLIKDTTREEREQSVAESLGNIDASCDGCSSGIVEMYQDYIDEMCIRDRKWGKASNYTLCLNSSQLGYDRCEKIIMECDMM